MNQDDEWGNIGNPEHFAWSPEKLAHGTTKAKIANKKRNKERMAKVPKAKLQEISSHRSKVGWDNLTDTQRQKRIEKTANSIWGDEEKRLEQIKLIREAKKGKGYWKGKKASEESRRKNSEALKGKPQYKPTTHDLKTPKGIFDGRKEAADAYGIRPDTMSKWISTLYPDKFYWIPKPADRVRAGSRKNSSPYEYHTPAGIFCGSCKEAAEANGVTVDIVTGRCNSKNYPDWFKKLKSSK